MQVGADTYINCKDVKFSSNQLIVARCEKIAESYTAADLGDATNYVDVDNVRSQYNRCFWERVRPIGLPRSVWMYCSIPSIMFILPCLAKVGRYLPTIMSLG